MTRHLYFRGHAAGLSNQRMSFEIGMVIAHLTDRVFVPYGFGVPWYPGSNGNARRGPNIADLFDVPVPFRRDRLFDKTVYVPGALRCDWAPMFQSVLAFPDLDSADERELDEFSNGRQHRYGFGPEHAAATDLHIDTKTLAAVAYFFFVEAGRRRTIAELVARFRPRSEYREVSAGIAARLGRFNAIHLRRSNFVAGSVTPRASSVTGAEIVRNIATHMDRRLPLLILTDGVPDDPVFAAIRSWPSEAVFLDEALRTGRFRDLLTHLRLRGPIARAVIAQLVATHAESFAGCLFSTFTATIHEWRGAAGRGTQFHFLFDEFVGKTVRFNGGRYLDVANGRYSWNRLRFPVSPHAHNWLCAWPEAVAPDATRRDGPPSKHTAASPI